MKKRILYITAFCLYVIAVLFLCLSRPENLPYAEFMIFGLPYDKVAHFLMFLPFPILVHLMFFEISGSRWKDLLILICGISLGIGAALGIEYLQAMTQYRSSDIKDVYAGAVGLSAGCIPVLFHILSKKRTAEPRHRQ